MWQNPEIYFVYSLISQPVNFLERRKEFESEKYLLMWE